MKSAQPLPAAVCGCIHDEQHRASCQFQPVQFAGNAIFTLHARDDATVTVTRTRMVVDGILAAAGSTLPNYNVAASYQHVLVANRKLEFHSLLIDAQVPGATIVHNITAPNLDLI